MATSTPLDPLFRGSASKNTRGLVRVIILLTIAAAAVAARLFSVIRTFNAVVKTDPHLYEVLG